MALADLASKLLGLSKVVHSWLTFLSGLETARRQGVSDYAEKVAATLGRAAETLSRLDQQAPGSKKAAAEVKRHNRELARELGRISGYVEDIVVLLEHHLDGRKLAGVKRRLEALSEVNRELKPGSRQLKRQINRLAEAEGYFRALADGLRV